jgi:archaellum component FlaC
MADDTTVGVISAIVAAVVVAIREAAAGVVRAIRGSTKVQKRRAQAEEDARKEEAAREALKSEQQRQEVLADRETDRIISAIADLGAKLERTGLSVQEVREDVAGLKSGHKDLTRWMENLTRNVDTIKRRSTGKVDD